MPATRPPSMADVAVRAGVSHQTVSRVLNGHAYVRPATRERVMAAIEELGYRPNQAARALVTARTATVGILTAGTTHYGPASTVLALESAARADGYFVSVGSLPSDDSASAGFVLDQLMNQGVDGVVVVAPLEEVAHLVDHVAPSVPVVVAAARTDIPDDTRARYVSVDQFGGATQATRHLIGLGHRRIAHVAGPAGWYDAAQRAAAYAASMEEAGLVADVDPAGGWLAGDGYAAGCRIAERIARGDGPTAVFLANDYLAMGVLRAFWEHGIRVPEDVSVVGFDDVDGTGYLVPALTTVRQPFARLGIVAMQALREQWDRDGEGGAEPAAGGLATAIPAELVVRDSTAAPRE